METNPRSSTFAKKRLKSYVPHLLPYWKATSFYFLLFWHDSDCESGWCNAIIKVAPLMALIAFVALHGASLQSRDVYGAMYSKLIFLGLTFSAAGDICLVSVWKKPFFLLGIGLFALAHVMYVAAFGFEKNRWKTGVAIALYAVCFWKFVTKAMRGVMIPAIGIYACIIGLMMWRAISRIDNPSDLRTSWTKLCSCVGAILFAFSDSCIAIANFVTPMYWSNQIIMSTYYLAQLGIALSVVDCQSKQRGMNLQRLMKRSTTLFRDITMRSLAQESVIISPMITTKCYSRYTRHDYPTSEPGSIDVSDASEEEMAQEPLVVHIALSLASDLDQKDVEIKRRKPEVKKNSGVSVAFALPNGHRHRSQSSQEETTILSKKERISTSSTRSAPVSAKTALSYDSIADKFREMERDKKVDNSKSQSICTTFSSKRRKDLT